MTIKELKEILNHFDDETEVKILVDDVISKIDGISLNEDAIFLYGIDDIN